MCVSGSGSPPPLGAGSRSLLCHGRQSMLRAHGVSLKAEIARSKSDIADSSDGGREAESSLQ